MNGFLFSAQLKYRAYRNNCDDQQMSVNGHKLKRRLGTCPHPDRPQKILASLAEEPWQTLNELQYTWNIPDKHGMHTMHNLMRDGLVECYSKDKVMLYGIPYRPLELPGYEPFIIDYS